MARQGVANDVKDVLDIAEVAHGTHGVADGSEEGKGIEGRKDNGVDDEDSEFVEDYQHANEECCSGAHSRY